MTRGFIAAHACELYDEMEMDCGAHTRAAPGSKQ